MLRMEHQALENLACGIAITDLNGVVLYVNPTFLEIWGHANAATVVGQNVEGLWQSDFVEHLRHCLLTGEMWTGDMPMSMRAGSPLYVRATVSLNRDQAKHLIGLALSFVDLTELRLAEQSIRREMEGQLNRARSQDEFSGLLNIVSLHDIILMIRSSRKSGFLEVLDGSEKVPATIVFAEGTIIQAAAGTLTGKAGVWEALRSRGTAFRFWHGSLPPVDPQIDSAAMNMLLDGYRTRDESEMQSVDVPEL
jgi:PAS domain S-box-containing protein